MIGIKALKNTHKINTTAKNISLGYINNFVGYSLNNNCLIRFCQGVNMVN